MMKLLIVVLLFFIVANPALFKVTRRLGSWIASPEGLPKTGGLLLHAVVFAVVTRVVMRTLSRRQYLSQYEEEEKYEEPEAYDEMKEA
jgi:uncharacterized membrane protein